MELNKILFIFILFASSAWGRSELPELATKQSIENIRFLSKNGTITIYQQRSGSLYLATNYKVFEIIKGNNETNYNVESSADRTNIIIEQDLTFHKNYSLLKNNKIFSLLKGDTSVKPVGEGRYPKLHLTDKWVSFYQPYKKELIFHQVDSELEFKIKLSNKLNPFFVPEVQMLSDNFIIYTDINKDGHTGLILYDRRAGKFDVILKVPDINRKLELCLNQENFFVAEIGVNQNSQKTIIYSMERPKIDMGKSTIIYESDFNDLGNLNCTYEKNYLYFVKNMEKERQRTSYEVAKFNLKDKKVSIISDVMFATNYIDMDGNLLLPYQGTFYVLAGASDLKKFDLLKKEDPKLKEK